MTNQVVEYNGSKKVVKGTIGSKAYLIDIDGKVQEVNVKELKPIRVEVDEADFKKYLNENQQNFE